MKNFIIFTIILFASVFGIVWGFVNYYQDSRSALDFDTTQELTDEDAESYETYGIGDGTTQEVRTTFANTLLATLNPYEVLPESFDNDLIQGFENGKTYFKFFKKSYMEDGSIVEKPSVLFKAYKDSDLTIPYYIYESNLEKVDIFGYVPAYTYFSGAFFNTNEDTYNTFFNTHNNLNFIKSTLQNTTFRFKNSENTVFAFNFKVNTFRLFWTWECRPSSLLNNTGIFNAYNQATQGLEISQTFKNFALNDFIKAYKNGSEIKTLIPAKINFVNTGGEYVEKAYIHYTDYYALFPIATPDANYDYYGSSIFKITNYTAYTLYDTYNYNYYLINDTYTYTYYQDIYNNYFQMLSFDTRCLGAKIPSVYFKTTYTLDAQNDYSYNSGSGSITDGFAVEINQQGVAILSLPYYMTQALSEEQYVVDNVFKIQIDQLTFGNTLLDRTISDTITIDMENYGQYLSYVLNEDLQKITILFNDNFQINENADYIQVSFLPVANSNEAYQTLLSNIFAELKV